MHNVHYGWEPHEDFRGASADTSSGLISHRGAFSLGPVPVKVKLKVSLLIQKSDAPKILTRSNLKRWGGYGEMYGVGAALNQQSGVLSLQTLSPDAKILAQKHIRFATGKIYEVELSDDGVWLRLYIDGKLELKATTTERFGDRACVYAHESGASIVSRFEASPL